MSGKKAACLVEKVGTLSHMISSWAAEAAISSCHLWDLSGGRVRGREDRSGTPAVAYASRKHTGGWLTNYPHVPACKLKHMGN